jgi:hypothetical protein
MEESMTVAVGTDASILPTLAVTEEPTRELIPSSTIYYFIETSLEPVVTHYTPPQKIALNAKALDK